MNLKNLAPLDLALAEHLMENAYGKFNAITSKRLRMYGDGPKIREMVHRLRLNGLPICSCNTGYYWAADSSELHQTVKFLESYLKNLEEVYTAVRETYYELKDEEAKN